MALNDNRQYVHIYKKVFAFLFLLASPFFTESVLAQEGYEHLSPLSHGAGRTYVVNSRGVDAMGLNPALLALGSKKSWEISILPASSLGADAGASFLSDKLTQIANNTANLDSGRHRDALSLLQNNGLSGRADARILAVYYHQEDFGGIGFKFSTHSGIRTQIPDDIFQFLNNYLSFADKDVMIDDIDAQGLWYNSWSVNYGRNLLKSDGFLRSLSVGAAIKYIQGLGYLRLEEGAYVHTTPLPNQRIRFEANYSVRYAFIDVFDRANSNEDISIWDVFGGSAGSGFGFDIGTAAAFGGEEGKPAFLLGVSVNDIGAITWTENTIERKADHVLDTVYYQSADIDATADTLAALAGEVTRIGNFTTDLPTTLRIGAALNFKQLGIIPIGPEITVAAEMSQGLSSVVGSLDDARFGLGAIAEWSLAVLSIRTAAGIVMERDILDVTLGVGTTIYDVLSFDISSARLGQLFNAGEGRSDVSVGLKVHL